MTAPAFHALTVREVVRETPDAISVRFAVPESLRDAYRYVQGQYVTLKAAIDGEDLRRSYSVCAAVSEYERSGTVRVGIKRIDGGRFSTWANECLSPGMTLEVMTPDGRFFNALDPAGARHYVAFAGGSGITPVLSNIKTILEVEPASRFTLVYGNRAVGGILFGEELEDLKNRYLGRLRLYHVISDEPQEVELFNGLLDRERCARFLDILIDPAGIDHAFICGPAPMMDAAEAALLEAGVARERIHVERFGTPPPAAGPRKAVDAGAPTAEVHLIQHGKSRVLRVPFEGQALLDAGLAGGMDLPFACKGGVCCTCRARVLEGEVRMDRNFSLEPHELAKGFVLTCQSHPLTPKVVVSYDER